jgi:sulfopyruvate decarboxylase TPP-binding subunit
MHTCPHLAKECILHPLLAVPCNTLENILKVSLSSPGIKVLGMTKEEQQEENGAAHGVSATFTCCPLV